MNRFGRSVNSIKRIVLILAVFVSGLLIGCTSNNSQAASHDFNMDYLESDLVNWAGEFYLYEDRETHVEYIVFELRDSIAITPRYTHEGKLYCTDD